MYVNFNFNISVIIIVLSSYEYRNIRNVDNKLYYIVIQNVNKL